MVHATCAGQVGPLLEPGRRGSWLTFECGRVERTDVCLVAASDASTYSVVVGALVVHLEELGRFHSAVRLSLLEAITSVQRLLILQTVLLEVGQFLHGVVLLIAASVRGSYSESRARPEVLSKTVLVCAMLLLKLHPKIVVAIRAVGNPARSFLGEELSALLILLLLWLVALRRRREVAHCLSSE